MCQLIFMIFGQEVEKPFGFFGALVLSVSDCMLPAPAHQPHALRSVMVQTTTVVCGAPHQSKSYTVVYNLDF